ncbi:MAG: HopJ type III effector protein [Thiotrichales bacterium]|nr:HopJ type III effector protein [Thiotrichales bacterium]
MTNITEFIARAKQGSVPFNETLAMIDANYGFTPTEFRNGETHNPAGTNNGSCKLFAFAQLHQLDESSTLNLFGDFYYQDVLPNPQGTDHQNIRNFIQFGWAGISYQGQPLQPLEKENRNLA